MPIMRGGHLLATGDRAEHDVFYIVVDRQLFKRRIELSRYVFFVEVCWLFQISISHIAAESSP
jgi:hypothetical protein